MSLFAELVNQATIAMAQASDIDILEKLRIEFLGKKGRLTLQNMILRKLSMKDRILASQDFNNAKQKILNSFYSRKMLLEKEKIEKQLYTETIDISLPGRRLESGSIHPVTRNVNRIENFFRTLGFSIAIGLEVEDEYHNFDALNIPTHHPARTDHDTFWIDAKRLLRTQTSAVQIHAMEGNSPPFRIISSGRVYRNDYDQTHTPMFHQLEGFLVEKNVSFTHLKNMIYDFLIHFFEENLSIRFRPSYFPFTEPSAEVDIMNQTGEWLEIMGCGMIHPNVLFNVGIDAETYSGFAFGMGIERLTMIRYNVKDLRSFFENDLRFLKQFK